MKLISLFIKVVSILTLYLSCNINAFASSSDNEDSISPPSFYSTTYLPRDEGHHDEGGPLLEKNNIDAFKQHCLESVLFKRGETRAEDLAHKFSHAVSILSTGASAVIAHTFGMRFSENLPLPWQQAIGFLAAGLAITPEIILGSTIIDEVLVSVLTKKTNSEATITQNMWTLSDRKNLQHYISFVFKSGVSIVGAIPLTEIARQALFPSMGHACWIPVSSAFIVDTILNYWAWTQFEKAIRFTTSKAFYKLYPSKRSRQESMLQEKLENATDIIKAMSDEEVKKLTREIKRSIVKLKEDRTVQSENGFQQIADVLFSPDKPKKDRGVLEEGVIIPSLQKPSIIGHTISSIVGGAIGVFCVAALEPIAEDTIMSLLNIVNVVDPTVIKAVGWTAAIAGAPILSLAGSHCLSTAYDAVDVRIQSFLSHIRGKKTNPITCSSVKSMAINSGVGIVSAGLAILAAAPHLELSFEHLDQETVYGFLGLSSSLIGSVCMNLWPIHNSFSGWVEGKDPRAYLMRIMAEFNKLIPNMTDASIRELCDFLDQKQQTSSV